MAKPQTNWTSNATLDSTAIYDQPSVTYDTIYSIYDAVVGNALGQVPALWAQHSPKVGAAWRVNPAAEANFYLYDSASHSYDSAVDTYDGLVVGQDVADVKTPAVWNNY